MNNRPTRLVDVDAKIVHQTPSAYLLDVGNDEPVWVPKSQVEDNEDGTFTMPERLAIEKGIA